MNKEKTNDKRIIKKITILGKKEKRENKITEKEEKIQTLKIMCCFLRKHCNLIKFIINNYILDKLHYKKYI